MLQPLLTRAQVRSIDQALIGAGVPGLVLMENAGRGAAEGILARVRELGLRRAAILVGPGNNGGDGLVVARHLRLHAPGLGQTVVLASDPAALKGDAASMRDAWLACGGTLQRCTAEQVPALLEGHDLLVDALFGTGLDRPLVDAYRALVQAANEAHPRWAAALDVPSGLDADRGAALGDEAWVFHADETFTFAVGKPGLHTGAGRRLAGRVHVVPFGVPLPPASLATTTWLASPALSSPRRIDAHKGDAGHVLVIGGSAGKTGAALLCARGAHRAGAGLVTIASRAAASIEPRVLETMTLSLSDDWSAACSEIDVAVAHADAIVAGPGLGRDPWAEGILEHLLRRAKCPLVLDADALERFAALVPGGLPRQPPCVVATPHPLELARMLGLPDASAVNADRLAMARLAADRFHVLLVLKGAGTVLATPDGSAYVSPIAEPALAVAGSGDVLAGVIAARLAERNGPAQHECVMQSIAAHGRAGERVRTLHGSSRGALAGEIADAVSRVLEAPLPDCPC